MKREDLTTKLHDQYNTFPSSIQDPEAFHHDVFEISNEASTTEEFHHMMAARKQQRLQELHESLESAAFEIIAHPKLIGTEQWQYALQLFRTRSLDSLVRYFSSYLSGYQTPPSAASSFVEISSVRTASTNTSSVDDAELGDVPVPTFLAKEDKASFTHEPQELHDTISISLDSKIPLSPRSMTMKSDIPTSSPSADDVSTHDFALNPPTPPRTLSFSGSEAESIPALAKSLTDDETSQSEGDSPAASEPDLMESRSSLHSIGFSGSESGVEHRKKEYYDGEEDIPTAQLPMDSFFDDDFETVQVPLDSCEAMEAETPTPRQETVSSCYIDSKPFRPYRAWSPNRSVSPKSTRLSRRDVMPPCSRRGCSRRSPEEVFSRIQKPTLPDPVRIRANGRTRLE